MLEGRLRLLDRFLFSLKMENLPSIIKKNIPEIYNSITFERLTGKEAMKVMGFDPDGIYSHVEIQPATESEPTYVNIASIKKSKLNKKQMNELKKILPNLVKKYRMLKEGLENHGPSYFHKDAISGVLNNIFMTLNHYKSIILNIDENALPEITKRGNVIEYNKPNERIYLEGLLVNDVNNNDIYLLTNYNLYNEETNPIKKGKKVLFSIDEYNEYSSSLSLNTGNLVKVLK